jgi:hypothetical protein
MVNSFFQFSTEKVPKPNLDDHSSAEKCQVQEKYYIIHWIWYHMLISDYNFVIHTPRSSFLRQHIWSLSISVESNDVPTPHMQVSKFLQSKLSLYSFLPTTTDFHGLMHQLFINQHTFSQTKMIPNVKRYNILKGVYKMMF